MLDTAVRPSIRRTTPVDEHVARAIRELRLAAGMSQEALGQRLGLSFQQVQKYEKAINRVSAGRLAEIARILRVTPAAFYPPAEGAGPAPHRVAALEAKLDRLIETTGDMCEQLLRLRQELSATAPRRGQRAMSPTSALQHRLAVVRRHIADVLYRRFFGGPEAAEDEEGMGMTAIPCPEVLLPGHPTFGDAVRLVREARLCRGPDAAMAVYRMLNLPWDETLDISIAVPRRPDPEPDHIARFIAESVEDAPSERTAAAAFYRHYLDWCRRTGTAPATMTALGRALSARFVKRKRNIHYYIDVRPRQSNDLANA